MDKEVVLWATLRRLRSSGFYAWDEEELAFVQEVVKQASFADCIPFLHEKMENYLQGNEERKKNAQNQYDSRKEEIDAWFEMYKPVFQIELDRMG